MTTRAANIQFLLSGITNPSTGDVLENGTVYFYESGTTIPKYVWTEFAKTNGYYSYTLDGAGAAQLYGEGTYRVVVKDQNATTIYTWDGVRLEFPYYGVRTMLATGSQLSQDDYVQFNTTSGAITYNCLTASQWSRPVRFERIAGTNSVTIEPSGAETITVGGVAYSNYTFDVSNSVFFVVSDGSNLRVIGIASSLLDADGDTGMVLDETTDDDVIRLKAGGVERVKIYSSGSTIVYISGSVQVTDGNLTVDSSYAFIGNTIKTPDSSNNLAVYASGVHVVDIKQAGLYMSSGGIFIGSTALRNYSETLTNKILTSPTINTPTINIPTIYGSGSIQIAALDLNGNGDASGTFDIGSSTTRRLAPAGTFVNNADGNPTVVSTEFAIHTNITENQWWAVYPTGGSPVETYVSDKYIWSALDSVPTDASYIVVKVKAIGQTTSGTPGSGQSGDINARDNGSNEAQSSENEIATLVTYLTDTSGNGGDADTSTHYIPITNRCFDIHWESAFNTTSYQMYLVGWGFNP